MKLYLIKVDNLSKTVSQVVNVSAHIAGISEYTKKLGDAQYIEVGDLTFYSETYFLESYEDQGTSIFFALADNQDRILDVFYKKGYTYDYTKQMFSFNLLPVTQLFFEKLQELQIASFISDAEFSVLRYFYSELQGYIFRAVFGLFDLINVIANASYDYNYIFINSIMNYIISQLPFNDMQPVLIHGTSYDVNVESNEQIKSNIFEDKEYKMFDFLRTAMISFYAYSYLLPAFEINNLVGNKLLFDLVIKPRIKVAQVPVVNVQFSSLKYDTYNSSIKGAKIKLKNFEYIYKEKLGALEFELPYYNFPGYVNNSMEDTFSLVMLRPDPIDPTYSPTTGPNSGKSYTNYGTVNQGAKGMFGDYNDGGTGHIIDGFFSGIESDNFTIEGEFIRPDGNVDIFTQIQLQNPVDQAIETFQIIEITKTIDDRYKFRANKIG